MKVYMLTFDGLEEEQVFSSMKKAQDYRDGRINKITSSLPANIYTVKNFAYNETRVEISLEGGRKLKYVYKIKTLNVQ